MCKLNEEHPELSKEHIEMIKLLFEASKLHITVLSGYLTLFLGFLSYIWKNNDINLNPELIDWARCSIILGVVSFGIWSGTIPFSIQALEYSNLKRFKYGQYCARIGHVLFFLTIISCGYFIWQFSSCDNCLIKR